MTSYTIGRGFAQSGLGEAPGQPSAPGEQYLWADPVLWNTPGLADAARHWLTLDFNAKFSFETLDFDEGWSCFSEKGFLFVARHTLVSATEYLTVARAWPTSGIDSGIDPGLLLGDAASFPSGTTALESVPPQPGLPPVEFIRAHEKKLISLIAHLYAARESNRPLLIVNDKFHSTSALPRLIAFARAALPEELRSKCSLRIYTRTPARYLNDLQAGVAVIPVADVGAALQVRKDAVVVSPDGSLLQGPDADLEYGAVVVRRVQVMPEAFFPFTRRFSCSLGVAAARTVYNLTASAGNQEWIDDLLCHLMKSPPSMPSDRWSQILSPNEWSKVGLPALRQLATAQPANACALELQRLSWHELRRRSSVTAEIIDEWWRNQSLDKRAETLFAADHLKEIEPTAAAKLACALTVHEFRSAVSDPRTAATLISLTSSAKLPAPWAEPPAGDEAWDLALNLMVLSIGVRSWEMLVFALVSSLFRERGNVPNPGSDLLNKEALFGIAAKLILAEMTHRSKARNSSTYLASVLNTRVPSDHRWLIDQSKTGLFLCLPESVIPADWFADAIKVVEQDASPKTTATAAGLRRNQPPPAPPTGPPLDSHLDQRWQTAFAWLSETRTPAWEGWKKAIDGLALKGLTAADLDTLASRRTPPWPWIAAHEDEQVEHLWYLAANDAARARLVQLDSRFGRFRTASHQRRPEPTQTLSRVRPKVTPATELSPRPVSAKAQPPTVESDVFEALLNRFATAPDSALDEITKAGLLYDHKFQERVAHWLTEAKFIPRRSLDVWDETLALFACRVTADNSGAYRTAARKYLHENLAQIADFLCPGITQTKLYEEAYIALTAGAARDKVWKRLDARAQECMVDSLPHPLTFVADRIRAGNVNEWARLDQNAWATLQTAVSQYSALGCVSQTETGVVPVLEVAALIRNSEPVAEIALDIITLCSPAAGDGTWWHSLIEGLSNLPRRSGRPHFHDARTPALAYILNKLQVKHPELYGGFSTAIGQLETKPLESSPKAAQKTGARASQLIPLLIDALARGDANDSAWSDLAGLVARGSDPQGVLRSLARSGLRPSPSAARGLPANGWDTLRLVLKKYPAIMAVKGADSANGTVRLEIIDLAKAVSPNRDSEALLADLVQLDLDATYLHSVEWWDGLFRRLHPQSVQRLIGAVDQKLPLKALLAATESWRKRGA